MAKRVAVVLVSLVVGGVIGAAVVTAVEQRWADRELATAVFVDRLSTTALCISALTLLDDGRSDAAVTLLRDRLASSLDEADLMEFSDESEDLAIPNLVESLRRARAYALSTDMGPEVVARADAILARLQQQP